MHTPSFTPQIFEKYVVLRALSGSQCGSYMIYVAGRIIVEQNCVTLNSNIPSGLHLWYPMALA